MRAAAMIGWLGLLAGCNRIFGLDPTQQFPIDAPIVAHVQLDYQVLAAPGADPEFHPIPGLANVQMAPLGQPLKDAPVDDKGTIAMPVEYEDVPIRMVFTIPGELFPREVVWTGHDGAHYAVPMFGPVDRMPAPADVTINLRTALGTPPGFAQPRMFTTGLWSSAILGAQGQPAMNIYTSATGPAKTAPLGGPLGTLDSASSVIWLFDYTTQTMPHMVTFASGFARATLDMVSGINAIAPDPTWMTPPATSQFHVSGTTDSSDRDRLTTNLGSRVTQVFTTISGGVTASESMPGSTKLVEDTALDDGVFFPLISVPSTFDASGIPPVMNPFMGSDLLPLVVRDRLATTRSIQMASVTAGFQSFFDTSSSMIDNNVGMAFPMTIRDTSQVSAVDLTGLDFDPIHDLPLNGAKPVELLFVLDLPADTCEVSPYKLDDTQPTGKTKLRSIDVIGPFVGNQHVTVTFDPDLFAVGQAYVIGITCRLGYFGASLANSQVDKITYPFRTSTQFPAAFHTIPVP